MASAATNKPVQTLVPRWLPSEHGFWVMLGAALTSAVLRAKGDRLSLLVTALVAFAAISAGGLSHRRIRKSSRGQLAATVLLALSSVPVELAAGLPFPSIAAAAFARGVVFLTSALSVRAAFACSARTGSRRGVFLRVGSLLIAILAAALLFILARTTEAVTCVIAAGACAVFVWSQPTAKQLKPLGLTLGGLAVVSAITLAL